MSGSRALPVAETTQAKFHPDGRPRIYPGNTILLDMAEERVRADLARISRSLAAHPASAAHTFLPAACLHMTLFRGVNDRLRRAEEWPADLPLDMPLQQVTEHFVEALADCRLPHRYRMRPTRLSTNPTGELQLALEGADEAGEAALRQARGELAGRLRHRRSGDEAYRFHITLSYRTRPSDEDQEAALNREVAEAFEDFAGRHRHIAVEAPALYTYETMLRFETAVRLSATGGAA